MCVATNSGTEALAILFGQVVFQGFGLGKMKVCLLLETSACFSCKAICRAMSSLHSQKYLLVFCVSPLLLS